MKKDAGQEGTPTIVGEQAEFEKAVKAKPGFLTFPLTKFFEFIYENPFIQAAWEGWQFRASLPARHVPVSAPVPERTFPEPNLPMPDNNLPEPENNMSDPWPRPLAAPVPEPEDEPEYCNAGPSRNIPIEEMRAVLAENEVSADTLGRRYVTEMIDNIRANVGEDRARRAEPPARKDELGTCRQVNAAGHERPHFESSTCYYWTPVAPLQKKTR